MTEQLTSKATCKRKHTYSSKMTANRARKRRNKTGRFYFTTAYQCNICHLWHLTTQVQDKAKENSDENSN